MKRERIWRSLSVPLMLSAVLACSAKGGCSARSQEAKEASPAREGEPAVPGVQKPDPALVARLKAATLKKGPEYKPRTHHLKADGSAKYTNRLILETSPYLLQHAHNPVNWHAWGPRAFETAKRSNRPILLSVGYSTCHWCHVMESESFEDEEVAKMINENFVAIKVDREERPDIDDVYMKAVRFLSGRGGWPMTIVMTPDKDPFFGGTYFPARDGDRGASKGFLSILAELNAQYRKDPTELIARAQETSQKIAAAAMPARPGPVPGPEVLQSAARSYGRVLDPRYGGFGRAPKFPRPVSLDFLFRYQHSAGLASKGDHGARHAGLLTLRNMAAGGIFDHVGGGFHRYSTDEKWLVPHFEKMLYDNAQLVLSYLDAYQITGESRYAEVATRTLDYVLREMLSPEGAFYSASDADSLGPNGHLEEGYFFTWTPQELEKVLAPATLKVFQNAFLITDDGNFEGRNILAREPSKYFAKQIERDEKRLSEGFELLYAERSKRAKPLVDTKVLTSWNGLMIRAFARAGTVLGRPDYIEQAARTAKHLLTQAAIAEGGLMRSSQGGVSKQPGFLEDYAFFMSGLIELSLAAGEAGYLETAEELERHLFEHFFDEADGAYFKTGKLYEELLAREKPSYDGAEPSGNSVATDNLLRLANVTGRGIYLKRAERNFGALAEVLRQGTSAPLLLAALQSYLNTPVQIIVVQGDAKGRFDNELSRVVRARYLPGAVVLMLSDAQAASLAKSWPFLDGKTSKNGRARAFVCERGSCELPALDAETLRKQLTRYALEPQASSSAE